MRLPSRTVVFGAGFVLVAVCVFAAIRSVSPPKLPVYGNQTLYEWAARYQKASTNFSDPNGWREVEASKKAIQATGVKALPFAMEDLGAGLTTREAIKEWLGAHVALLHIKLHNFDAQHQRGASMLQALGPIAAPCLPELEADAKKGGIESFYALMAIGPAALPAFTNLLPGMTFPQTGFFIGALANSVDEGRISPGDAAAAIPSLVSVFHGRDTSGRSCAAEALGAIHQHPEICIPLLIQGVADNSPFVSSSSVRALAHFGGYATPFADTIAAAFGNTNFWVRSAVCAALLEMRGRRDVAIPLFIRGLNDKYFGVRTDAAAALGLAHSLPQLSIPALTGVLRDPDVRVRKAAAQSIGFFRGQASNSIPALRACFTDTQVSNAAWTAVGCITGEIPPPHCEREDAP